jgi:excinuclease ABC subunit C
VTLQEKLDQLPAAAGVYLMKDVADDVLYVGKATSLRSRVRSYFQPGANLTPRLKLLVASVRDLDFVVADSEAEALVLEFSLIQKHRPRFNVRYRDDKSYPYIRIDLNEEFPALCVVRQHAVAKDGARYFGPYPSARDMWETIRLVRRIFRVRQSLVASAKRRGGCPWKPEKGNRKRPCLEYHIKRCLGPCVEGLTTKEDYRIAIRQVCDLLEGKWGRVLEQLRAEMEQAAESLKYEAAAAVRDQIEAIETTLGGQRVVSTKGGRSQTVCLTRRESTPAAWPSCRSATVGWWGRTTTCSTASRACRRRRC